VTLLVTGASGFMGRALVARLAKQHDVVGLVRSPGKAAIVEALGARPVLGDITDRSSLDAAMQGCRAVFHLAAAVGESTPPEVLHRTNVGGTTQVAQACAQAGVARLIHASSTAVYGSVQEFDIDETRPVRRSGQPYHDSKVGAEEAARATLQGSATELVILRPSHVYGPESEHFTKRPIRMLLQGKAFVIGDGSYLFKPLFIDNFVDAAVLALERPEAAGEALNLTDGFTISWRALFDGYADLLGCEKRYRSLPRPVAMGLGRLFAAGSKVTGRKAPFTHHTVRAVSSRNSYSPARAQQVLGWHPEVDFAGALERVQAWLDTIGGASSLLEG
jgi:nucleoside-diphosphate-sugar epimerase